MKRTINQANFSLADNLQSIATGLPIEKVRTSREAAMARLDAEDAAATAETTPPAERRKKPSEIRAASLAIQWPCPEPRRIYVNAKPA